MGYSNFLHKSKLHTAVSLSSWVIPIYCNWTIIGQMIEATTEYNCLPDHAPAVASGDKNALLLAEQGFRVSNTRNLHISQNHSSMNNAYFPGAKLRSILSVDKMLLHSLISINRIHLKLIDILADRYESVHNRSVG